MHNRAPFKLKNSPEEKIRGILLGMGVIQKTEIVVWQEYPAAWYGQVGIFDDCVLVVTSYLDVINIDIQHCHGFDQSGNMILRNCIDVLFDQNGEVVVSTRPCILGSKRNYYTYSKSKLVWEDV